MSITAGPSLAHQLSLIQNQFQADCSKIFPSLANSEQEQLIKSLIELYTRAQAGKQINMSEIKIVIESALSDESRLTDDEKKELVNFFQTKLNVQVVENLGKVGYITMKTSTFKALLLAGLVGMALIKKETFFGYSTNLPLTGLATLVCIPLVDEKRSDGIIQPILSLGKKTGQLVLDNKEKLGFATMALLFAKKLWTYNRLK